MIGNSPDPLAELETRIDQPIRWEECEHEELRWLLEAQRRHLRIARFAAIEDPDQQTLAIEAERRLCALDPFHWLENYVWIQDPHRTDRMREIPLVLWPAQRRIIDEAEKAMVCPKDDPRHDLVIIKPRALGVSWTFQAWFYWRFCFSRFKGLCLSAKERKVDDKTPGSLFGKFRYIHERLPDWLQPNLTKDVHMHIERDGGAGALVGDSTSGDAFRGDRGDAMLLDEFAAVEAARQEALYFATDSVVQSRFFASTAQGPANRYAKLVKEHPNVLRFSWRDDPRNTEAWAAEKQDVMGKKGFAQEYGGEVVSLESGLIWIVQSKASVRYGDDGMPDAWRKTKPLVGGWDFGSGPSLTVCLFSLTEYLSNGRTRLWIDDELMWSRTEWHTIAADTLNKAAEYGPDFMSYGDPAGINKESNQESWQSNLQAGGVPVFCLKMDKKDGREYNEWGFKIVQRMLDTGELRIHDRCSYLWSCVENWSREVPHGIEIDYVSKAYIGGKHDVYSHGGMALVYLVRGALAQADARRANSLESQQSLAETVAMVKGRGAVSTIRDLRVGRTALR